MKSITFILCGGAIFGSLLGWVMGGISQEQIKQEVSPRIFFGSKTCYTCHNRAKPFEDPVTPPICRCTEFEIWETTDKHRLAYLALQGVRAKKMAEILQYDVQAHKACVACHGVWIDNAEQRKKNQPFVAEGVSCFVCHSTEKVPWVDTHGSAIEENRLAWRKKSRQEKEEKDGMRDLWDPTKRTRLCASCHIGNAKEGKILTHEMYAAGHPPLPSFDMANFSNAMRHWQYLAEKDAAVLELLKLKPTEVQREQMNLILIGSLVSLQESLALLEDQASKKDAWPELAQFDCYACHHDLKTPSWRQKRNHGGKPGRPQMQTWPTVLAELALAHAASGNGGAAQAKVKVFDAKLTKLQQAFQARPFGDAGQITHAAKDLAGWLARQTQQIQDLKDTDKSTHKSLLVQLLEKQKSTYCDYESARQVAGAFRAIYVDGRKESDLDPDIMDRLARLDNELSLTFRSDARKKSNESRYAITRELAGLRKNQPGKLEAFLESKAKSLQDHYHQELHGYLQRINDYEPEKFQKEMKALGRAFSKSKE